ncbi:MAG: O-antigen ligase family protein [Pirellulaceae bacterium]|nr:O-antigen ligase family protein [Pirellulaceae bacterium]
MSITALAWVACYLTLTLLALQRPVWGVGLYLLTFYLSPAFWWWGGPLVQLTNRINLLTALIFAAVTFLHWGRLKDGSQARRTLLLLLLLYVVNATLVHYLFAANPAKSLDSMSMIWKQVGLAFLLSIVVQNRQDLNIFISAILVGTLYIGYEVVVNDRGTLEQGRLVGIGTPGANETNYLAGLLTFAVPLAGCWLLTGQRWQQALALVCLVPNVEVILRCKSRGAFLALLIAASWLFVVSTGKARRYAFAGLVLALLAVVFMAKDQSILERFTTTFAAEEERDSSAQSRIDYWVSAVRMIGDYPLGSGGEAAFKSNQGMRYITHLRNDEFRAVHQGYLDICASWGIQGLSLYLLTILLCWLRVGRIRRQAARLGRPRDVFLGACLESVLLTQMVVSIFISSLDGEWFFWWFALAVSYERVCQAELNEVALLGHEPPHTAGHAGGGSEPPGWPDSNSCPVAAGKVASDV